MAEITPKGKPLCERCGKIVDRVEETRDDFLRRVEIRVFCHGEIERVTVDYAILNTFHLDLSFTVAFRQPKALPGEANRG